MPDEQPILYFDGVCNLCNNAVQFVIRHDKQKKFLFASLQSAAGKEVLQKLPATPDSMVLYASGKYHLKSSAALHTARLLGGIYALAFVFIIIPGFIRNAVYDLIARNRYTWFGKREECMIPTPELKSRFLS